MKPFNLKEAMAGKPICDGNGQKVTFVAYSEWENRMEVIVRDSDGDISTFTREGTYFATEVSEYDLFMAEQVKVKKEGWIALYHSKHGDDIYPSEVVHDSKADAEVSTRGGYPLSIIKIEWEE